MTGAPRLVAFTTVENSAAQRLLISAGAELAAGGSTVTATVDLRRAASP